MKKVYFLCLLLCMSFVAGAQVTTTIWAHTAASGTFKCAYAVNNPPSTAYATVDNLIAATNSGTSLQAGYAVFDLSIIPTIATISSVTLGLNENGSTVGNPYTSCNTYGHLGDMSTVSPPVITNQIYNYCTNAASFGAPVTTIATATTATSPGSYLLTGSPAVGELDMNSATLPGLLTFVSNVVAMSPGELGTISFSCSPATTGALANVYNFTGETGSQALLGPHAPFLTIVYCFQPTNVTASVSPNPVCTGRPDTLTGSAFGATYYTWAGPGGFSTAASPSITTIFTPTVVASSGVYTLTAYAACGTSTVVTRATTTTLTVNQSPDTVVTTNTTVCSGNTIYMSDNTGGGVWNSSNTSVATVTNGTVVAGTVAGTSVISYSLGSCPETATVTVNNPPGPISGPNSVCASGGTITLSDAIPGGTWTSGTPGNATVNSVNGVVTGVVAGPDLITYVTGACPPVNYPITVNPLPVAIAGGTAVCAGSTLPLSDATTPGAWSSSNTTIATVGFVGASGVVTGVSAGPVVITYSLPTACYVTQSVTVNPLPSPVAGASAVCVGQAITLSDPSLGGTWSSGATLTATVGSVTGVVTGVASGGVNISYTFISTGCSATLAVTVDPLPDPIGGPTEVCAASHIQLSDDITPGTWSSQFTAIATVGSATGDVTGVSGGVSYITYTLSNTGCYDTHSVTVNPLPTAVITPSGPETFCTGGSVTLTATTGTGYGYQWFSGGGTTLVSTTNTYVSNSTETIVLQVTDGNNCVNTDTAQITLIPNVTIAAGGPTVFCHNGNVLLSVPLAPNILYQWMLNGANIAGANSNTFAAILNGVYTCSLVVPGGCSVVTPGFTVTVYPLPVPPIYNNGVTLTTTNSYLSYQWFLNSVAIPGATTTSITPAVNGNYTVRVTDGNSCVGYAAAYIINNLSVASVNKTDIKIYPNPATSIVNIESPVNVRAVITGMEGKTIMEQSNATALDISNLPEGIYLIMLYDNDGKRLMVQKLLKE